MDNPTSESARQGPRWPFYLVTLIAVFMVCATVLVVAFRSEIVRFAEKSAIAKSGEQAKRSLDERFAKMRLQFTDAKAKELLAKRGTVSITDHPLGNVEFAQLQKPFPANMPRWCDAYKEVSDSAALAWKRHGYEKFIGCRLKEGNVVRTNPFMDRVLFFCKQNIIKRVRWMLVVPKSMSGNEKENFELLTKEYVALGYSIAEEYGPPVEEDYGIDKGYEDDLKAALKLRRAKAERKYQAKDGKVEMSLRDDFIVLGYYVEE